MGKRALLDAKITRCQWSTKIYSEDEKFVKGGRHRLIHKSRCLSHEISEVTGFDSKTVEIMLIRRCKGPRNQKALKIQSVISAKGKTQREIFDILDWNQEQLLNAICEAWGLSPESTQLIDLQAVVHSETVEIARKVSVLRGAGNSALLNASALIVDAQNVGVDNRN